VLYLTIELLPEQFCVEVYFHFQAFYYTAKPLHIVVRKYYAEVFVSILMRKYVCGSFLTPSDLGDFMKDASTCITTGILLAPNACYVQES